MECFCALASGVIRLFGPTTPQEEVERHWWLERWIKDVEVVIFRLDPISTWAWCVGRRDQFSVVLPQFRRDLHGRGRAFAFIWTSTANESLAAPELDQPRAIFGVLRDRRDYTPAVPACQFFLIRRYSFCSSVAVCFTTLALALSAVFFTLPLSAVFFTSPLACATLDAFFNNFASGCGAFAPFWPFLHFRYLPRQHARRLSQRFQRRRSRRIRSPRRLRRWRLRLRRARRRRLRRRLRLRWRRRRRRCLRSFLRFRRRFWRRRRRRRRRCLRSFILRRRRLLRFRR